MYQTNDPGQTQPATPGPSRRPSAIALAVTALFAAAMGTLMTLAVVGGYVAIEGLPVGSSTTVIQAQGGRAGAGLSAEQIYKLYSPSVVHITAEIAAEGFSNPFGIPVPRGGEAIGSGFVVDQRGYILTNQHVVDGATKITVTLESGSDFEAQSAGEDRSTDLALLKIDAGDELPKALSLADSAKVRVGDTVYAIGNPLGLDRTLTSGIVSAKNREIQAPNGFTIRNVVQTDAAINRGNSGGPLLDHYGRVIGINSQIASQSGGSEGIAFAVPSNTIKSVFDQLRKTGRVSHPWLGVAGTTIAPPMNKYLKLPVAAGALITDVYSGSPAAKAGLRGGTTQVSIGGATFTVGGDIIVAVAGKTTKGMDDVVAEIERHKAGDRVTVTYYRDGKRRQTTATLAERPENLGTQ